MVNPDFEDPTHGDAEDVEFRPLRSPPDALSTQKAAELPPGTKMASRQPSEASSQEFITYRTPSGAARIPLSHYPVLAALWGLWARKRAGGEEAGVSVAEIAEDSGLLEQSCWSIVTSLLKNRLISRITVSRGYGGRKARFYPTTLGQELYALAEYLGYGSSIQIGKNETAWADRSNDEPESFFQWAKLLRGGI